MANDTELSATEPAADSATRIPKVAWDNLLARSGTPAAAIAAAIAVGALALALSERPNPSLQLVARALAGTEAEFWGMVHNGPTDYFPDQFDQRRLPTEDQPPTF